MPGSIQSIERAAAVLQLLGSAGRPMGLQEVAAALELPKATAHGIVRTLFQVGFVDQERSSGRYRLGNGLQTLGTSGMDSHELRSRSMNWTDRLAARTGLEVHLGVAVPGGVQLVHHVFRPDNSAQRLRLGEVQPLHATALGKALLAYAPSSTTPLSELALERYTARTCVDASVLGAQLGEIRFLGHACDDGEFQPDVASVAAPIRRYGGLTVGALAVTGPRDRLVDALGEPRRKAVEQTVLAARSVSTQLEESR
ncbi:MAG: IclR family transcriptional regulator [Nocardioidaceae bacterium]